MFTINDDNNVLLFALDPGVDGYTGELGPVESDTEFYGDDAAHLQCEFQHFGPVWGRSATNPKQLRRFCSDYECEQSGYTPIIVETFDSWSQFKKHRQEMPVLPR